MPKLEDIYPQLCSAHGDELLELDQNQKPRGVEFMYEFANRAGTAPTTGSLILAADAGTTTALAFACMGTADTQRPGRQVCRDLPKEPKQTSEWLPRRHGYGRLTCRL